MFGVLVKILDEDIALRMAAELLYSVAAAEKQSDSYKRIMPSHAIFLLARSI